MESTLSDEMHKTLEVGELYAWEQLRGWARRVGDIEARLRRMQAVGRERDVMRGRLAAIRAECFCNYTNKATQQALGRILRILDREEGA